MYLSISESTDTMRRRILSEAEREAESLVAVAKSNATEILNAAKKRANEMKEAELERMRKHMDETLRQDIAEKKVDYHRRIQAFKSELIDDIFRRVRNELKEYVEKPAYRQTLNGIIIEAGTALGGGELLVKLNEKDQKLISQDILTQISKDIEKRTKTETKLVLDQESIKAVGGATVSVANQRATMKNTLEIRLERIIEEAKAELETILFK